MSRASPYITWLTRFITMIEHTEEKCLKLNSIATKEKEYKNYYKIFRNRVLIFYVMEVVFF